MGDTVGGRATTLAKNPSERDIGLSSWLHATSHPLKESAILGMAMVDAERALSGNTLATMQLMDEKNVPDTMNADRFTDLGVGRADEAPPPTRFAQWREGDGLASSDADVLEVKVSLQTILQEPAQARWRTRQTARPPGHPKKLPSSGRVRTGGWGRGVRHGAGGAIATWPASAHRMELRTSSDGPPLATQPLPVRSAYCFPSGDYTGRCTTSGVVGSANAEAGSPITFVFGDTQGTPGG